MRSSAERGHSVAKFVAATGAVCGAVVFGPVIRAWLFPAPRPAAAAVPEPLPRPIPEPTPMPPVPHSSAVSLAQLVESVRDSVGTVLVYGRNDELLGQGTGWFVAPGQLITNHHVIANGRRCEVRLHSGSTFRVERTIASDARSDLALLDVPLAGAAPALPLAEGLPREGERIAVIGTPLGLEQTVSDGIVSSVRLWDTGAEVVQITAPISPGSSGSPVIDMNGRVVGVATSQMETGQSLNFAVAASVVKRLCAAPAAAEPPAKAEPTKAQFAEKMLAMAAEAMREGRLNDAATNFRQATRAEPRNAPAWLGLAWSLSQLDQPNDALAAYREAVAIRPDWAEAHLGMGGHLLTMRRIGDAVSALERAVTLAPNMSRARFTLALAHLERGDRAGAVRQYQVLRDMDAEMAAKLRASIYPDDAASPK